MDAEPSNPDNSAVRRSHQDVIIIFPSCSKAWASGLLASITGSESKTLPSQLVQISRVLNSFWCPALSSLYAACTAHPIVNSDPQSVLVVVGRSPICYSFPGAIILSLESGGRFPCNHSCSIKEQDGGGRKIKFGGSSIQGCRELGLFFLFPLAYTNIPTMMLLTWFIKFIRGYAYVLL